MKETLAPERVLPLRAGTILSTYRALLAHRGFMDSLAGGMGQAGMFAYIVGSPRIFIELYGIAPQYYGLLFGANAAALIVGFADQRPAVAQVRRPPAAARSSRAGGTA